MEKLAPELLSIIFSSLDPRSASRCREVCWTWNILIKRTFSDPNYWRNNCMEEYQKKQFNVPQIKVKSGLQWENLYRSLYLWTKFPKAIEVEAHNEFILTTKIGEQVCGFQIMKDGIIGIHRNSCIRYYYLNNLSEAVHLKPIIGKFEHYFENEELIILLGYYSLYVIRKFLRTPHHDQKSVIPNIKNFTLKHNDLYVVTRDDYIYVCNIQHVRLECRLVARNTVHNVLCVEHVHGKLCILTVKGHIYVISSNGHVLEHQLHEGTALRLLRYYNLLEHPEKTCFFWHSWMCRSVVKLYGDLVFVGTFYGYLKIYRTSDIGEDFDLDNAYPIKEYRFNGPQRYINGKYILNIDVLEVEGGHKVILSMSQKIVVIDYRR